MNEITFPVVRAVISGLSSIRQYSGLLIAPLSLSGQLVILAFNLLMTQHRYRRAIGIVVWTGSSSSP
ncbi:MAG: hypothetical protein KatS3mg054_1088 [Chloroflexus sp.]|nr:MAG: hypothetical protein KatS3mg054_1088 [Chloroflexus sp.]GIV93062.1 MAG: hypothetical protein KatS3mg056_1771 [Chloroflexus sp.]